MSSFASKGLRQNKLEKSRETKKHIKGFYKILHEMDVISNQLDIDLEYNEENIDSYVLPMYGRELDSVEKFALLGKLHHRKENNNKEDENKS